LLLACSRLGVYAMPMPQEYPPQRLLNIANISAAAAIVWDEAEPQFLTCSMRSVNVGDLCGESPPPPVNLSPWQGGVVLSSSGSTGTPKLIVRPQASFYHRLAYIWRAHPYAKGERGMQKSHVTTTHCVYELLEPLCRGVPVHIFPDVGKLGISGFWQLATSIDVQRLLIVPSLLAATVEHCGTGVFPTRLKLATLNGESPQRQMCEHVAAALPALKLLSFYGSTEASHSMVFDLSEEIAAERCTYPPEQPSVSFPLGVPISQHIGVYVLDAQKCEVQEGDGMEGTLHISGPHLFVRYLGLPELTAKKRFDCPFVQRGAPGPDPDNPAMYNTNDLVQFKQGRWEHKGRSDDVVKIRGFRVQLGEVDHQLRLANGVSTSVTLHINVDGRDELLSFVTPGSVDVDAAREEISKHLAAHMMPRRICAVDALPMTASGKPNRQALKMLVTSIRSEAHDQQKQFVTSQGSRANLDAIGSRTSSTEQKIIELLCGITGATARSSDRIASTGLDSLNMMKMLDGMHKAFPAAEVSDLLLLANPTVAELAVSIEAGLVQGGKDGGVPQVVNMDAVGGLRALFSLWIMRGHLNHCNQDTEWIDIDNYWRVNIYIILAGSTTAMLHDKVRESWWVMMKKFVPFLPLYYISWFIELPLNLAVGACEDARIMWLGLILTFVLQHGNFPRVGPLYTPVPMGHAWYLSAQMLFYCVYNWMQDLMERKTVYCVPPWCCGCWDDEGSCACAGCSPSRKGRPIKRVRELLLRIAQTWLICLVVLWATKIWRVIGPLRLPQFYLGMLVGQACLHVDLDERGGKILSWVCDVMVFFFILLSFAQRLLYHQTFLYWFSDGPLAFLIFALYRSPNSWSGRFLASYLSALAPYSYGIYLLQVPIMNWGKFTMRQGVQTWKSIVKYDYAQTCWRWTADEERGVFPRPEGGDFCHMPGFSYITLFSTTIVLSMLLTHLVHDPFQRFYNRRFLSNTSSDAEANQQPAAVDTATASEEVAPQIVGASVCVQPEEDPAENLNTTSVSSSAPAKSKTNILERSHSVAIDTAR